MSSNNLKSEHKDFAWFGCSNFPRNQQIILHAYLHTHNTVHKGVHAGNPGIVFSHRQQYASFEMFNITNYAQTGKEVVRINGLT